MGVPPPIRDLTARNEVVHAYSAHAKVHEHFGDLTQNVPLEARVNQMAAWTKKVGARQGQVFKAIEVARNPPPFWAVPASQAV